VTKKNVCKVSVMMMVLSRRDRCVANIKANEINTALGIPKSNTKRCSTITTI
jgi:hypothetical protein